MGVLADLAAYRTAMGQMLGSVVDGSLWTNEILDLGLREALREYGEVAPVLECNQTVTTSGYRQDLSGMSGLLRLVGLACPWWDGARFTQLARRWALTGNLVVELVDYEPSAGEVMRVRYRAVQTVANLDGATATTVGGGDAWTVVRGACGWAANVRYRQLVEAEHDAPEGLLKNLWEWQQLCLNEFRAQLERLARQGGAGWGVCWGNYGL
jgi:hypothetical protein